jgi:hypothetical protein
VEYDRDKVDEVVLALLGLTMFEDRPALRAWKGHDWDALDRLHKKGYISDPRSKAKSVLMTEEGAKRAQQLLRSISRVRATRRGGRRVQTKGNGKMNFRSQVPRWLLNSIT